MYGPTYYYRCYASNALSNDWADFTTNFVIETGHDLTGSNALTFAWYNDVGNNNLADIDDGITNGENAGLFDLVPTPEAQWPAQVQGKSIWTDLVGLTGMSDTYCAMWWGYFRPPETGTYEFYMAGDDHEILWIDVDRNGEFEASAGEDISRNVPPEDWNTAHTETVYLEAGKHYAIAIAMHEQAGGDFLDITIKKPGGTAEDVNPGAASQDGWWYRDLLSIDPSVANDAATVSYPNYTMNATLRATQAVFDAYIYWGTSDGGAAEGAWANTNFIGSYSNDNSINLGFTTNGLPQSTTYYYTFRVENSLTNICATPTTNFTTLGPEYFLPFVETFEDRTLGNLDGQYGWSATGTEVQGGVTHAGSKAACIGTNSTDEMSHTFVDGQTDVWTDFYTRPKFGDPASAPTPPQYSTMAFFVSTNGQVIAFNGSTPTQLNHTALVDGSWVRFTTHSDYMDQKWDLYVDGDIVGTGMDFYTNATSYTRFGIVNSGTNSAYVDDINILLKPPRFIQGTVILVR